MDVNFRYVFEKNGEVAPENILENNLWIDVGNAERDGAFDHHQDGGFKSAFECVMRRTDCYKSLHAYLKAGHDKPEVVIHVHEYPDADSIFGIYAVQRMIREGKDSPAEAFAAKISDILIDYVNKIDSGIGKCITRPTLYAYLCAAAAEIEDVQKRSLAAVEEGTRLLELVVQGLEAGQPGTHISLFETPLEEYIDTGSLTYYKELHTSIQSRLRAYHKDKTDNRVVLKSVNVWNTAKRRMEPVKAAIWKQLPTGNDEYILAREEDKCLLTVYPHRIHEDDEPDGLTQAVIALNPNLPEAADYSLLPLAEVIEQCEQIEEDLLCEKTHRYRRDHSRQRVDGRFAELPFCETSDPWYISEEGDIIDAPRDSSLLPYSSILAIIDNASSMTRRAAVVRFCEDDGHVNASSTEDLGELSFGGLYRTIRERLRKMREDKTTQHIFAYIKIDPSMLKYSNRFLKSCCLYMVGKRDSELTRDNILQIDYGTCLYADQSVTILAAIDKPSLSLKSLINEESLEESRICTDLRNLLEHRQELRSIGNNLSQTIRQITEEYAEIDRFNERLVRLNTRMQEDDIIADPLEQEVYAFIKNTLGIEPLKASVTASTGLLIKNAEELRDRKAAADRLAQESRAKQEEAREAKRDSRIQAGIGLVTVFAVFSAWVDAFDFFAKLVPGSEGGWSELAGCTPVLVLEIVLALFIFGLGLIAAKYVWKAWREARDGDADDGAI